MIMATREPAVNDKQLSLAESVRLFETTLDARVLVPRSFVQFTRQPSIKPNIHAHMIDSMWQPESSLSIAQLADVLTIDIRWAQGAHGGRDVSWQLEETVTLGPFVPLCGMDSELTWQIGT